MSHEPALGGARPRVLVLARAYPNSALPAQGLWVDRLVQAATPFADPVVLSPIARVVPGVPIPEWEKLARVPPRAWRGEVPVLYPRVLGGLMHFTHALDARLALPAIRAEVLRLHSEAPFALIHAHFIYPDGVMAARLGRELGIPVVTTEHANWRPWLDEEDRVRGQVLEALRSIAVVTAVSEGTRRSVREVAGGATRVELLPNVLDDSTFNAAGTGTRVPGRVLFVGAVRRVKGLDVLVRAMPALIASNPGAHLRVVGSPLTRSNRKDGEEAQRLAQSLGLTPHVEFVGHLEPAQVAEEMRQASVLAVPSRRESFSAVTIESLACGTPVVATRCGGPEELLDDAAGRLVAADDPAAMAAALGEVLDARATFDPLALRARVMPRFGYAATTQRLRRLYGSVLG